MTIFPSDAFESLLPPPPLAPPLAPLAAAAVAFRFLGFFSFSSFLLLFFRLDSVALFCFDFVPSSLAGSACLDDLLALARGLGAGAGTGGLTDALSPISVVRVKRVRCVL